MVRKDGTTLPVVLNATAIYDKDGNYLMSRSSAFDITELMLAEEKLHQNHRLMVHQSRHAAMGEMIGNIAHQWRQPLNTLGLLVQQIPCFYGTDDFDEKFVNNFADNSMKLIDHMSQTIDDFRNFFKPDREKINFDVNRLVKKTISLVEASFISQNITIKTEFEENLVAYGYPNEYCQVLLTVLNNARDAFSCKDNIKPLVLIRSFSENSRSVLTITDNAGGIKAAIIDMIFEPYFTTKGSGSGTGIGLYMSKKIIQNNMGGTLTARNTADGAELRIEV
jgi:C4-dicarboxylate-specific signal transduction histidine kinase